MTGTAGLEILGGGNRLKTWILILFVEGKYQVRLDRHFLAVIPIKRSMGLQMQMESSHSLYSQSFFRS